MKKSRNFTRSLAFPTLILFSAMPAAFGQEPTNNLWTNGAATLDWNTAGNWDSVPTGTQAVPTTGQNAGIENGDTVSTSADAALDMNQVQIQGNSTLNLNHSMGITPTVLASGLRLGNNGGFGTLNVNSGGNLNVSGTGSFRVGRADNTGTLTLVDGGSITTSVSDGVGIGRDNGSIGLFTMTGGTFTQTAGEFRVGASGNVKVGSGTFNISDGIANINKLRVTFTGSADGNGAGTVNQTGGTVNNTDEAAVGWSNYADATYNLEGGTFTSSKRLRIGQSNNPGATNHFNQTGGDVDITGRIDIGENAGPALNLYSISAGTLDATGEIMLGAFNDGVGTFTMSGTSEVSPGDIRLGWANAGSKGTLNLNGGTLYAKSITTGTLTTQANVVNMNGVLIEVAATGKSINSPASALTVVLQAGGGTIDTNGFNYPISVPITGVGNLTKEGVGVVNFTATNTYTGDTIINGGNIFENSTGTMSFKIGADGVNNKITGNGTGSFNADGTFIIDVSTAATNGTWTIVDIANLAVYNRAIATFNVLGWTDGGTTWTTTANGADYTYNESTGILTAVSVAGGYATWASSKGLTVANDAPTFDAEFDGIENLLEYVLVGDPLVSDTSILPDLSLTSTDYVFTFLRSDESEVDTVQTFQYGTNLAGWTDVTIGDVSAGQVTVVENGTDADDITVTIPRSEEDGGKLFGRLRAVQP